MYYSLPGLFARTRPMCFRACLVPVFSFGENELFHQASNPAGSYLRRFQESFKWLFGFSPPLFYGRGVIRPLDESTYGVRSAYTNLRILRKLYDCSRHKFGAIKCLIKMCCNDIFVDLQPFGFNLRGILFNTRLGETETSLGETWGRG